MAVVRVRPVVDFTGEVSRTKQSFKDQTDINKIIARFGRTGMLTHVNTRQPFYGDVSMIDSYQSCLNVVKEAQELFAGMSSAVRKRFGNDPSEMISFLQDPANLDEAVSLGMAVKRPVEPVAPVNRSVDGSSSSVLK